ncbi:hypothetical protein MKW92_050163 [Papaver armeniacum]|nr:hypothetical protein MKW92_050163 [Papaver armeniacum]
MIGGAERKELNLINFEETELRLGLPGGSTSSGNNRISETIDLKLNLETSLSGSIKESSELVLMDHHHRNDEKINKSSLVSENKSIKDKTSVTNCSNEDHHAKPSARNCETQGMKDFMNESKLMDLLNGSEYVPTYEDKDGDWMLVGDVPWRMFVHSCKRLRIMKGSEAVGLGLLLIQNLM